MKYAAAIAVVIALSAGCAGPSPQPVPEARIIPEAEHADGVAGVRVIVREHAWPGRASVTRAVTPVQVTIKNGGGMPLRIQYREFALVDGPGTTYAALPPFPLVGVPRQPLSTWIERAAPGFSATGFEIAHFYAPLYPRFPSADPVGYEPLYYNYYAYWEERDDALPSAGMLARALLEGVLNPGGRISGFLYFEKVAADDGPVLFRMDLVDPRDGRQLGVAEIPLSLADG